MNALLTETIRRTRQHHAIEHATIHILAARQPARRVSGISDPLGFTILGEMDEVELRRAVGDALLRLQAGEATLAIHPNCGTNLAVTGVLVTLAAMLANSGRQTLLQRFTNSLLLVLPALILSRPLGYKLQRYTTLAEVADRWVQGIYPLTVGGRRAYRVLFE